MAVIDELRTVATWDGRALQAGLASASANYQRFGIAANFAFGGAVAGLFLLTRAAAEQADETAKMTLAANNFGGSFPLSELSEFSTRMQHLTGVSDDQVAAFLGLLGAYQLTKEQSKQLAPGILDAAAALKEQGVDTETLARQIGQAVQSGNLGRLGRLLGVDEAKFGKDRIAAIEEALKRFNGRAAELKGTLPGSIEAMNNALQDARGAIANSLVRPLTIGAQAVEKLANTFAGLPQPIQDVISVVAVGAVGGLFLLSAALKVAELRTRALALAQGQAIPVAAAFGQAQTAAATGTTAAGTAGTAARFAGAARFGGAAAAAFAADEALKAAGLQPGHNTGPEGLGSSAADWVRTHILGLGKNEGIIESLGKRFGFTGAEKKRDPAGQSPADKTNELLGKIEKNTADLSKAVGNRDIARQLGGGRIAREVADALGGRA